MTEYNFVYDKDESFDYNFYRWYYMNCTERSEFKERLYTKEEGKAVFKDFINYKNAN